MNAEHADHWPWRQISVCVYCGCGQRLYQGTIPKTQDDARALLTALADLFVAATRKAENAHD